jgi:hypothetical protein
MYKTALLDTFIIRSNKKLIKLIDNPKYSNIA